MKTSPDFENIFVKRARLASELKTSEQTECLRVLNEFDSGVDLDAFFDSQENSWILFGVFKENFYDSSAYEALVRQFEKAFGGQVLVMGGALKSREGASRSLPILFSSRATLPSCFWTKELGLNYRIEVKDVLNPGLFMDQRLNRSYFRSLLSKDSGAGSVLNLFSYTGAFSIVATAQGRQSVSVDVSKRYLTWEGQNQEAQKTMHLSKRIPEDSRKYLERAQKRKQRFSWIVIDPPTFSKGAGKVFQVRRELLELASAAQELLEEKGGMLLSTNDSQWSHEEFFDEVSLWSKCQGFQLIEGKTPDDFTGGQSSEFYPLKSAWLLRNF